MGVLATIEQWGISVWVRETPSVWAFPFVLFLHTLGLGLVAGISVAMNAWLLRFAERWPLTAFQPLFALMWTGFAINFVSGVLLLCAYPAKALTDPVFYVKLMLVAGAVAQLEWLRGFVAVRTATGTVRPLDARAARIAWAAIVMWAGAILAGRLLAYTYRYLTAADMPGAI